jgi:hypothetical protein
MSSTRHEPVYHAAPGCQAASLSLTAGSGVVFCGHAYHYVFPAETHRCVGKETGETARLERWNNTLHQRVGR